MHSGTTKRQNQCTDSILILTCTTVVVLPRQRFIIVQATLVVALASLCVLPDGFWLEHGTGHVGCLLVCGAVHGVAVRRAGGVGCHESGGRAAAAAAGGLNTQLIIIK